MREILFRGKRVDNGEWVEGWLTKQFKKFTEGELLSRIQSNTFGAGEHQVKTETVGQYTGSKDENDKKIFEGDIVYSVRDAELAVIKWDDFTARFIIEFDGIVTDFDNYYASDLEVVGNIHDNPELLEVTSE